MIIIRNLIYIKFYLFILLIMKINIVHDNTSNSIMNDAETLNYMFKRLKEKPKVEHINIKNYTCPESTINIFLGYVNSSFLRRSKFNILIPDQHYFHKNWVELLPNIDLILCKTKYRYDTFKDYVPKDKIKQIGWRSADISTKVEKENADWLVLYTDSNYIPLQKLIDSWNRSQVLKDLRFYQVLPGLLASPFIVTGVFFHQIHLIETKSWSITLLASSYPFFALSVIGVTFGAGWIIDRFGTVHLLRFFLLPLAFGLFLIAVTDKAFAIPIFMILMGASAGSATIVISTLWVELYGINYLGSIRSMFFSMVVLATSISPALIGLLLDTGVTLEIQFIIFAIYIFICSIIFAILTPNLLIARSPPS